MSAALSFLLPLLLLGLAIVDVQRTSALDDADFPKKALAMQLYLVAAAFFVLTILSRIAELVLGGSLFPFLSFGTVLIAAICLLTAGFFARRRVASL